MLRFASISALALALLLGCTPDPQPRSAYEVEPMSVVANAEFGEVGGVEGFAVAVIREGQGAAAGRGDYVRVHFIALLADGSELDSSHAKDPLLVHLGGDPAVIEGVHEGAIGMRAGELRRITIPPKLGYRNRGGVGVPVDTNLTFLVELVEIVER